MIAMMPYFTWHTLPLGHVGSQYCLLSVDSSLPDYRSFTSSEH